MAGVYVHIPFCRKACNYCNFHFSTTWKQMDQVVEAMFKEIAHQNYVFNEPVSSIYFGGGTPSVLTPATIDQFLNELNEQFAIEANPEVTLEVNPDDTSSEYFAAIREIGVNRLSIGIQSFFDEDLNYLGRVHNADQAETCIKDAKKVGFEDLTIDLIYGIPTLTEERWHQNLGMLKKWNIPHFSAYALTVEPKTLLEHQIRHQKSIPPEEQKYNEQFNALLDFAAKEGYHHYEISNFAKNGFYARHNSSYWDFKPYVGFGPGAHSFDGTHKRQWNISNNARYVKAIGNGESFYEQEVLDVESRYNEYVMTSLRTSKGVNQEALESFFGRVYADHFKREVQKWIDRGCLVPNDGTVQLKSEQSLFADQIIADLFKA